jgi:putative ABC transport system ATP-binding protein
MTNHTQPDEEGPVVRIEDMSRDFQVGDQTIHALRDVSFDVGRGDFVAVIGRSGSGKTTLLNMIAGLDKPSNGHVYIEGQDISTMPEKELTELRRHKIGFVFQSFGLLPLLSAYENVEIALRIAGAGIRERSHRTKEVLEMVGLTRRADHRPYELSGGEQQRVAIARALANRPALILADEPTGELDSTTAATIFQLLLDVVAREKVTIITTTHDRLVMEKAERVLELADGALLSGVTTFEKDRREAVTVPWTAPAEALPQPVARDEEERERWSRPERRPIYQPPGPPIEPL